MDAVAEAPPAAKVTAKDVERAAKLLVKLKKKLDEAENWVQLHTDRRDALRSEHYDAREELDALAAKLGER